VPELSRPIEIADLPNSGKRWMIESTAAERAALARRFEIEALDVLGGLVHVTPLAGGQGVIVEGQFEARVTQRCVISLEPFQSVIAEHFRLELRPPDQLDQDALETFSEVDVEPLEGSTLDLGELVAQYLSLALDPHPRRSGVSLDWAEAVGRDDGKTASGPFAVLGDLKRKM
jgi:uncharacterized metal-binding protein YceD (DUF177 family)